MAEDIIQRVLDGSAREDYYHLLGVAPLRSESETPDQAMKRLTMLRHLPLESVKAAFMCTCKAIHPDKCSLEGAHNAMGLVNKAWTTMQSPVARAEHGRRLEHKYQQEAAQKRSKTKKQAHLCKPSNPWVKQQAKPSKTAVQKDEKDTEKHPASDTGKKEKQPKGEKQPDGEKTQPDGSWHVCGFLVKELKGAFRVSLGHLVARKFAFNEWHDKKVAREVATEFAKKAHRALIDYDAQSKKKDKVTFMATHGWEPSSSKTTIAEMRDELEQAWLLAQQYTEYQKHIAPHIHTQTHTYIYIYARFNIHIWEDAQWSHVKQGILCTMAPNEATMLFPVHCTLFLAYKGYIPCTSSPHAMALFPVQVLINGKSKPTEEHLRSVFQKGIGADKVPQAAELCEGITWNKRKNVFQACCKIREQFFVKEFPLKEDAFHWIDLLRSLDGKKLLAGHLDTMKQAAANRKATQEAYDKILNANKSFRPEESKAFQRHHKDGTDIWQSMWGPKESKDSKVEKPSSLVKLPKNSVDRMKELGAQNMVVGELLAWEHKTLGWRVATILTHAGDGDREETKKLVDEAASTLKLAHIGFMRCDPRIFEQPDLREADTANLKAILEKQPLALALVVTYPTKIGSLKAWELKAATSKAGSSSGGIKEVDLSFISRRVEGEEFLVKPLMPNTPLSEQFPQLVRNVFVKHLEETAKQSEDHTPDLVDFRRIPVPGDGLCFFHCFLRSSLPDHYENKSRTCTGAPLSNRQLEREVDMAKSLHLELMDIAKSKPQFKKQLAELEESTQVSLELAQWICQQSSAVFRITLSKEAKVVEDTRWLGGLFNIFYVITSQAYQMCLCFGPEGNIAFHACIFPLGSSSLREPVPQRCALWLNCWGKTSWPPLVPVDEE